MKPLAPSLPSLRLAAAGALLCGAAGAAQAPAAELDPRPPAAVVRALEVRELAPQVAYDTDADGALWARGERWKMRFDGSGACYHASFGATRPTVEVPLSPARATLGGAPLEFAREPAVRRVGDRVELDRGAFVEAYELGPHAVEQLFVLESLPRVGELSLHIPLAEGLFGVADESGLRLESAHGAVSYSRAVAVDAAGRRAPLSTTLDAEGIAIRVEADWLAAAQWPVVIDPLVTHLWLDSTTADTREPDAVYDSFNNVWLAVYHQVYSATDNDVAVKMYTASGTLIQTAWVDLTSAKWSRPRIAYEPAHSWCLAVAEVGNVGARQVYGRLLRPNGTLIELGTSLWISILGDPGDKHAPTVGGWAEPLDTGRFCVAFQHELPGVISSEVRYAVVAHSGTLTVAPLTIPAVGGTGDLQPSLCRLSGGGRWTLAFRRNDPVTFGDIHAAYLEPNGAITGPFGVTAFGIQRDAAPAVSSPLFDASRTAIAYERRNSALAKPDVWVSVLEDGVVIESVNLVALDGSPTPAEEQITPSIDSDGLHFLVAYAEWDPVWSRHETVVSDLFLSGDELGVVQAHQLLWPIGLSHVNPRVAARRASATGPNDFMVAHQFRQNDVNHDVAASIWRSQAGGASSTYCYGDGSGAACPCGNSGAAGRGCANSTNPSGGLLIAAGELSTLSDTGVLVASGLTPGQPGLFFQGTTELGGVVFGEGLRCAGGAVVRLGTRTATAGGAATWPGPGDPTLSVAGGVPQVGATRTYQVWYRDPSPFCNGSNYNLTNGLRIQWAP